jgi:prepilin-type N-terminal cleavage/methylation domain-containing protein
MNNRSGFTLIEVLVAMVLLGFAVLGVQAAVTDRFVRNVGMEDQRAIAHQLAADRIAAVQNDPRYTGISSNYAGSEDPVSGFAGYRRDTFVRESTGYTVVTVQVLTPVARDTVVRTVAVGAP